MHKAFVYESSLKKKFLKNQTFKDNLFKPKYKMTQAYSKNNLYRHETVLEYR